MSTHSSLTVNSSLVGNSGSTNEKSEEERSLRKRRCSTPGCMVGEGCCVLSGVREVGVPLSLALGQELTWFLGRGF